MQLTVPRRFQGIEGMAQGGHVGGLVAEHLGEDVAVSFRHPCPLERPLELVGHRLLDGDTLILEAVPDSGMPPPPRFVRWDDAVRAREWAEAQTHRQTVSTCFSCGSGPDSLRVHAGMVTGTGLHATPLVLPAWTSSGGTIQRQFLWAVLDCAAGWRVSLGPGGRPAVTGRLRVVVHTEVEAGEPLVVVAEAGRGWDGRKRQASSAIHRPDGTLVATAESLWIALP